MVILITVQHLGQHFLKNKVAIEKIVNALELKEGEVVVEVGAGHGELTKQMADDKWLTADGSRLIAVEKDGELAQSLVSSLRAIPSLSRESVAISPIEDPSGEGIASSSDHSRIPRNNDGAKVKVINGDILKILPQLSSNLKPKTYKLVGNIPYYLTGFLFRAISELKHKPSLIVFTVQKEVAERICARPLTPERSDGGRARPPKMNLLAASIQVWAKPEIIGVIPPSDFEPPPKINSAILRLRIRNFELGIRKSENYYKLIKIIFKQPRKTLLNNLADGLNLPKKEVVEKLKELGLDEKSRGQDLTVNLLIKLTEIQISKSK